MDECLEAHIFKTNQSDSTVVFESIKTGYITLDDWKEINPKKLLEEITQNTEEANKGRRERKSAEIHVIGWIHEPILDKHTNTVY